MHVYLHCLIVLNTFFVEVWSKICSKTTIIDHKLVYFCSITAAESAIYWPILLITG